MNKFSPLTLEIYSRLIVVNNWDQNNDKNGRLLLCVDLRELYGVLNKGSRPCAPGLRALLRAKYFLILDLPK